MRHNLRPRTTIPDSDDDSQFSETSLRNSSPLRRSTRSRPLRAGGSSLSQSRPRVIQDSEADEDDYVGVSDPVAPDNSASGITVVVPVKNESPSDSNSRSSLGNLSTGYSTPATSVGAAVTEPDTKIAVKTSARINAADRVKKLQSSALSLGASKSGRKRPATVLAEDDDASDVPLARASKKRMAKRPTGTLSVQTDPEASDIALAHALQMEEYEHPHPTTEARLLVDKFIDGHMEYDSDPDSRPVSFSSLSPEPPGLRPFGVAGSDTSEDPLESGSSLSIEEDLNDSLHDSEGDLPPTWEEQRKARRVERDRKNLVHKHPTIGTMWDVLKAQPIIQPKEAKQPVSITRKLKPFQLEGLNWMIEQEKTQYKGGLLGDEMGMGKTIQAVSLIMSDFPQPDPTLVLVPPVALMQWVSEIKEYTDGKLKVLVYHNSDAKIKKLTSAEIRKYDVIMISYASLESIYRKQEKGFSRGETMVKADSVIHAVHYHRLILDEAHSIKSRTTGVAKACFALEANYKWCLSGTPVQNRIGEFFSLLRFLQVKPFACYFCKQCDCEQLQWTSTKEGRCTECSHTGFMHISIFNKEILNPIIEGKTQQQRKDGLDKLRLITDHIMLRRMKQQHTKSMELPSKRITLHNEFFGEIEQDFSRSIMTNSTRKFDTYVSEGVMLNNYANIFGLIMQMRQVANHPDLILKKKTQAGFNIAVCCVCDEPAEDAIRSQCRHEFCRQCAKDYIQSFQDDSKHVDCPHCHIALSIDLEQPTLTEYEESVKKNSIINRISMESWTSSTKIEMLLYELFKERSKSHTPKSIIFSQFTSMLQLVEWRLRHAGFNTVMLDGSMTPAQRQKSIEHFMTKPEVEVFLVSLKAGGVALNLTEASRVFIIDPWWNPAAEWQSADRSHRIGQQRPCVVTRLCIEDSVESRIIQLQEKKANLIRGTLNKDQAAALEKLTPEDMQFLFRGT
ncbi:Zinc finger RING-type [Penicillium robsamsonii]|uniref:Zinc finger RING-type n=1 Tax=Penicillium robsamsonii TaxID=1792511 RepID=UPI002549A706|nr:Zinc finger RING-type [Penicillium robsamsonii]KAJ5816925.1 Zinc finger RING-type [Penicillium robsamsonii]